MKMGISIIALICFVVEFANANNVSPDSTYNKAYALYKSSSYEEAISFFELAAQQYKAQGKPEGQILCHTKLARCYRRLVQNEKAFNHAAIAESIATKWFAGNNLIYGEVWNTYGLLYKKSDFARATGYFKKSIQLFKQTENYNQLCHTYDKLAGTYYHFEYYDSAEAVYEKTRILADSLNMYELLAYSYHNLANINKIRVNYQQARIYLDKAVEINNQHQIYKGLALVYLYMALAGLYMEADFDLEMAYEKYREAEKIATETFISYHPSISHIYDRIGKLFFIKKQYYKAIQYYSMAISNIKKANPPDYKLLSKNYFNIALTFQEQEKFDFSNINLDYAIECQKKLVNPNLGLLYWQKGYNCHLLREYGKSLEYYEQAEKEFLNIYGNDHCNLGLLHLYFGKLYLDMGETNKGTEHLDRALPILKATYGQKNQYTARYYKYRGDYHLKTNEPRKALVNYQRAMISLVKNFNDTNLYSNPKIDAYNQNTDLLGYLKQKANALNQLHGQTKKTEDLEASLHSWNLAVKIFQNMEASSTLREDKLKILDLERDIFVEAIDVAWKLYSSTRKEQYIDSAFKISENGKAWLLQSKVKNSEAQILGGIPDSLMEKERALKLKYDQLKYRIDTDIDRFGQENGDTDTAKINETLFSTIKELEEFSAFLEKKYPSYFKFKYQSNTLSLETLKSKLGKKNVLLEYYVTDSSVYTIFISNKKAVLNKQPIKNILQLTTTFNSRFYNLGIKNIAFTETDVDILNNIYDILINPYEKYIEDKNIIIIPDKQFAYLPFEILLKEKPEFYNDFKNFNYLIKNNPVQYAYYSSILFDKNLVKQSRNTSLQAFAPSYNDTTHNFKEIPFSKEEVNTISKYFNSNVFVDVDATENNFKKNIVNGSILHLAMHTIVDENNPMNSRLAFSFVPDSIEDGFLNTYEVYNLNLNAKLAVLSACKTGYGKLETGEGIMSIARAFSYAGCPSVVMTLWSVEDVSSSQLMSLFYKYLKKGKTKSEALQMAKLEYLENSDPFKAHPYFWAGYLIIGDSSPIENNRMAVIVFSIAVLMFAVSGFYLRKYWIKK